MLTNLTLWTQLYGIEYVSTYYLYKAWSLRRILIRSFIINIPSCSLIRASNCPCRVCLPNSFIAFKVYISVWHLKAAQYSTFFIWQTLKPPNKLKFECCRKTHWLLVKDLITFISFRRGKLNVAVQKSIRMSLNQNTGWTTSVVWPRVEWISRRTVQLVDMFALAWSLDTVEL